MQIDQYNSEYLTENIKYKTIDRAELFKDSNGIEHIYIYFEDDTILNIEPENENQLFYSMP